MAAIYPLARGWSDNPRVANAKAAGLSSRRLSDRAITRTRTSQWQKLLKRPDIAKCIVISKLRCIFTLVSLALLVTDIPRTGLGVRNLRDFYPVSLMPSTAVRFGPFNYPVLHIQTTNDSETSPSTAFVGTKGDQPVPAARVWPYQYDTTSVGLRGAVELLNVTDFPSFLLYKPEANQHVTNANSLIDLSTAFTMLDAFITAALDQLIQPDGTRTTLRYATKHNWVDRIHHYVVRFVSKNPAWRLHSLHAPRITRETRSLAICSSSNAAGTAHRSSSRPRFCNHPGIWKCKNPIDKSLSSVRLWEHMDLRLQILQQQYPDLKLDVALVSSQRLSSTSGAMRSTFYKYEALEIVVLTRGRRCTIITNTSKTDSSECTTVFVDDYRYERDNMQTNLVDWYGIISFLRGGAQTYVWLRLLLLVYGAFIVAGQSGARNSRLLSTALILLKIPFQVIVYSSLLPVVGYVVALLLDSSFMDIFLDSYWASVGGSANLKMVPFLQTTAVQMRCVWLLALLAVCVLFGLSRSRYHNDGIPGIRGLLIGFTSSLTVFGPYKDTNYRDMNIVSLYRIPTGGLTMDIVLSSNPSDCFNASSFFFGGSSKTVRLCIAAVAILALLLKTLGCLTPQRSWTYRSTRALILRFSRFAPCGMERLWINTSPIIHFNVHVPVRPGSQESLSESDVHSSSILKGWRTSRVAPSPRRSHSILPAGIWTRQQTASIWSCCKKRAWPPSKRIEPPSSGLCWPTTESSSVLQLMNVAMMTDPCNFFRLRVTGIPLYLYKIRLGPSMTSTSNRGSSNRLTSFAIILPYPEDEMEERTGFCADEFQLLDSASSNDVPMSVMLRCG